MDVRRSDELPPAPRIGDELVAEPRWSWTHAVDIDASAEQVWPWVAQVGADRGGFYSYQWLENLAGCRVHNAEAIHPEWAHKAGDELILHPKMPPLRVVSVIPGAVKPFSSGKHAMATSEATLRQVGNVDECKEQIELILEGLAVGRENERPLGLAENWDVRIVSDEDDLAAALHVA